jgi:hypothetical protein
MSTIAATRIKAYHLDAPKPVLSIVREMGRNGVICSEGIGNVHILRAQIALAEAQSIYGMIMSRDSVGGVCIKDSKT